MQELPRQVHSTLIQPWIALISLGKESHIEYQPGKPLLPLDKRLHNSAYKKPHWNSAEGWSFGPTLFEFDYSDANGSAKSSNYQMHKKLLGF